MEKTKSMKLVVVASLLGILLTTTLASTVFHVAYASHGHHGGHGGGVGSGVGGVPDDEIPDDDEEIPHDDCLVEDGC